LLYSRYPTARRQFLGPQAQRSAHIVNLIRHHSTCAVGHHAVKLAVLPSNIRNEQPAKPVKITVKIVMITSSRCIAVV